MLRFLRPGHVGLSLCIGIAALLLIENSVAWANPRGGSPRHGGVISTMEMPSVVGRTRREAITLLEQMGLTVDISTRIGARPNTVMAQDPQPGTHVDVGATVAIQVAIRPFVQTVVPDVRGMEESEAVEALRDVYVVQVVQTTGPRDAAGTVLRQRPRAGKKHPYRGDIRLEVCQPPTIVPRLIGRRVRAARDIAEAYGLVVDVQHVDLNANVRPGTVTAQNPRSGAEVLPGATIALQVAGKHAAPVGTVRMPDLTGLEFDKAQQLLWSCGISPRWNDRIAEVDPYCVVAQSVAAGTKVSPTSAVTVTICRPRDRLRSRAVAVPDVRGLSRDNAMSLLRLFGARVMPRWMPSPLEPGTALAQFPEPGTPLRPGGLVILGLARKTSHHGHSHLAVRAPSCEDQSIAVARARALRAGLMPRLVQREHPDRPLDRVVEQHPAAGRRMRAGRALTLVIPARVQMQDFVNKPFRVARAFCEEQGLNMSFGDTRDVDRRGRRMVVEQSPQAGTIVAKGSTVAFRLVRKGRGTIDPNPPGARVRVPELVGRTLRDARALLQARGLRAALTGPPLGRGVQAVVTAQDRPKGSIVHRGATVRVAYRVSMGTTGGIQPAQVAVPNVGGKSASRAKDLLQAAGLRVKEKGIRIQVGKFKTRVIKQEPPAGTAVSPGSEVTIHLGF